MVIVLVRAKAGASSLKGLSIALFPFTQMKGFRYPHIDCSLLLVCEKTHANHKA